MYECRLEELYSVLNCLELLCRIIELNPASYDAYSNDVLDSDVVYEYIYELINTSFDQVYSEYLEDWGCEKYYLSDSSLLEYYTLCREHASLKGIKLKEDPYYTEPDRFVNDVMRDIDGYGYNWILQKKINHQGASGLVVVLEECFYESKSFALNISVIPEYYREKCEQLKAEIAKCQKEKSKFTIHKSKRKGCEKAA